MKLNISILLYIIFIGILFSCKSSEKADTKMLDNLKYISWKEHVIDDFELSDGKISGGDGLVIADLDQDGFDDVISVHESDWKYDGIARGYIRIAFGTNDPDIWELATLGEGQEVGAVEDVVVGDINNDGFLDIVAACELAHIIYFENPKTNIRTKKWSRLIPEITLNRGSFIRVFTADFNNDGKLELVTANKGSQSGYSEGATPKPISYFEIIRDPLVNTSWKETVLVNVLVPINCQPIDIDNDGDLDIIGGSRGENRIILMENISKDSIQFMMHTISTSKTTDFPKLKISGFNMDFIDLNNDKLLDIVLSDDGKNLLWLQQPDKFSKDWMPHKIGTLAPDIIVGFKGADINNDSFIDFIVGSYSKGSRTKENEVTVNDHLGSIAWFENPKDTSKPWVFHPIVRRKRGMYDQFIIKDMDNDGDVDFLYTRGNSHPFDGTFWLEQVKSNQKPTRIFTNLRKVDSEEVPFLNR